MPDVRDDAKWVQGMEVGGDYAYLTRTDEGEIMLVRLCVLSIHEPTCTVSILETRIFDEAELSEEQRAMLTRFETTGKVVDQVVRLEDAKPRMVQ